MSISLCRISQLPAHIWAQTAGCGPASVFYRPQILNLWSNVYGWRDLVLHDDRSLLIGFVKSTLLGKFFYSLPFGWYGGVIGDSEGATFAREALKILSAEKFALESIVWFGEKANVLPQERYRCRELATHILVLKDGVRYDMNTERNVKKASKEALRIKPVSLEAADSLLTLVDEHELATGKKRKVRRDFYQGLLKLAKDNLSGVEFTGAWHNDLLVACHIYLSSDTDLFYFDGFSNRTGRDMLANFRLFDARITAARRDGALRLNLGSSPMGDAGLARFKEGWGAQVVKYIEYYRTAALLGLLNRMRGSS